VARSIVMTHEDAEDAVQEGFLRAYQALGPVRSGTGFRAWLNRIVANAALDLARRRKVRMRRSFPESIPTLSAIRRRVASCESGSEAALVQLPDSARP